MGDKGGKKGKEKNKQQQVTKHKQEVPAVKEGTGNFSFAVTPEPLAPSRPRGTSGTSHSNNEKGSPVLIHMAGAITPPHGLLRWPAVQLMHRKGLPSFLHSTEAEDQ